jgi:hypothetical protein
MEELRCLVCQGQSIADSNAELAGDMRALVRQRIAAGESPEQVRAWLIERYGDWVSYRPPVEPLTWPLWAAPLLLLLCGAWLLRKRLVGSAADGLRVAWPAGVRDAGPSVANEVARAAADPGRCCDRVRHARDMRCRDGRA